MARSLRVELRRLLPCDRARKPPEGDSLNEEDQRFFLKAVSEVYAQTELAAGLLMRSAGTSVNVERTEERFQEAAQNARRLYRGEKNAE